MSLKLKAAGYCVFALNYGNSGCDDQTVGSPFLATLRAPVDRLRPARAGLRAQRAGSVTDEGAAVRRIRLIWIDTFFRGGASGC
jgi:hypothetical protein